MNNDDPYFEVHSPAAISPERVTNVIEVKIAQNTQRRGTVQAAEGLAHRTSAEAEFAGGFTDARATDAPYYPAKLAPGRSPLADGISDSGNPAWVDDRAALAAFMGSADAQELHRAWNGGGNVPELSARSTPSTFTDLSRLDLSERGRQTFGKTYASNAKQIRHNEAEVND